MLALMIVIALILVGFYFHFAEWVQRRVLIAMGLIALYFVFYWFFAPVDEIPAQGARLFEGIPTVSFAAILFPQLNQHNPEKVTQGLGWFGLVSMFIILFMFIINVW